MNPSQILTEIINLENELKKNNNNKEKILKKIAKLDSKIPLVKIKTK